MMVAAVRGAEIDTSLMDNDGGFHYMLGESVGIFLQASDDVEEWLGIGVFDDYNAILPRERSRIFRRARY